MKNIIVLILALSVAFFTSAATPPVVKSVPADSTLAPKPAAVQISRLFPEDTVGRFITKFGKDSLLKVIDQSIRKGENFILGNGEKLFYDYSLLEFMLVAKHFNLRISYNEIDTTRFDYDDYRLYDLYFGNLDKMKYTIDSAKAAGVNLTESLKKNFEYDYVKNMIAIYCEKFSVDKELMDKLFTHTNTLHINDKMYNYWRFVELNRNCEDTLVNTRAYQHKLFTELYAQNNLKACYLDTFPKTKNAERLNPKLLDENTPKPRELEIFSSKFNPMKLLAYALYGNDVNLQHYSENLIYLLDAQHKDGSWSSAKKFNYFDSDMKSTIYGLWALAEFRDRLRKE